MAFVVTALGVASTPAAAQVILHVDDDASPSGDGLSWSTAFDHVQDALDVAAIPGSGVTEIRVAQGRYVPTARTDPGDPRSATFQLLNGVALRGGFAGVGAPDPDSQDPESFVTTLSGDLLGDDLPNYINNGENVLHIVTAIGISLTSMLSGFVVSGGNANIADGLPETAYLGGGMLCISSAPHLSRCVFSRNAAGHGGGIYAYQSSNPFIENCAFSENIASHMGGGIRCDAGSSPSVSDCLFRANVANTGGAIAYRNDSAPLIFGSRFEDNVAGAGGGIHVNAPAFIAIVENCRFSGNSASAGVGGAFLAAIDLVSVLNSEFLGNDGGVVAGGLDISGTATAKVENCRFAGNTSSFIGGGMVSSVNTQIVNCVFSRNDSPEGGGLFVGGSTGIARLFNCTFNENLGYGMAEGYPAQAFLGNCIFRGNSPGQIYVHAASQPPVVEFCNIQGGWAGPGSNNIDADPLFLQPGCGNFRLAHNSPCINAGSNALVPPGTLTDLDGNPRIQDGIVDMGAYEGGHDPLPLTACDDDFDPGELLQLIPAGGAPVPTQSAMIDAINFDGPHNSSISVTQIETDLHPNTGGYSELGSILALETSLAAGDYFTRVYIPFDAGDLDDLDPLTLDLTAYNAATGAWELAALGNTVPSPGHPSTLGDRIVAVDSGTNYGLTFEFGDYGVFWNPSLQRGFVWANVDHAGDFAFGVPLPQCLADCAQPPDGMVNVADLTAVIRAWGSTQPGIPQDVNDDGIVNVNDLLAVVGAWGKCP